MSASLDEILVTGASQGLGRALSFALAKKYPLAKLILVARDPKTLNEVKTEIQSLYPTADIVLEARDLLADSTAEELAGRFPNVSVLINNAGIGFFGEFIKSDLNQLNQSVLLNCTRPMQLCQKFGQLMCAKKRGLIVNVASMGGFFGMPYFSTYGATKSFLVNLGLALDEELRSQGVRVMTVCPGGINTRFHLKAGLSDAFAKQFASSMATSEDIAQSIVNSLDRPRSLLIPGFGNRLFLRLLAFVPLLWPVKAVGRIYRRQLDA
jgi:short-subunit dehydrogenase